MNKNKNKNHSYSPSNISDIDQDQIRVQQAQNNSYTANFDFDCKKILHLWLTNILPGYQHKRLKYDFCKKQISGQKYQCLAKIQQCQKFISNRVLKTYSDEYLVPNSEAYLQYKIDAKIYRKQMVQKVYEQLLKNYKLEQLKQATATLRNRRHYCLISLNINQSQHLQEALDFVQKNQITRTILNQVKEERAKKNEEISSKKQYKKKYIAADEKMEKQQKKANYQRQYCKNEIDLDEIKNWIKKEKNLQYSEFEFQVIRNKVIIKLFTQKNVQKKIKTINFYLNNTKYLIILEQDVELVQNLIQKLYQSKNTAVAKIFKGYINQNLKIQQALQLFKNKKITNNPTKKYNKIINFLIITGIKTNVQQYQTYFFQNKVRQIYILQYNLSLDIKILLKYLQDQRVTKLVKQQINTILQKQKYNYIKICNIQSQFSKLILKIQISSYYMQKIKKHKTQIQQEILKTIQWIEIWDYSEITQQLHKKHLILKSTQNQAKAIIIQTKDKIIPEITSILKTLSQQQIVTKQIQVKQNRITFIKQYVFSQMKNYFVNKSKISYIQRGQLAIIQVFGHQKVVNKSVDIINKYINKLEKEILQSNFVINDIQAAIIQKKLPQFQKQIYDEYKLCFTLNKNVNVEAIITLGQKNETSVDQNIVIYVNRKKNYSNLPRFTTIAFFCQDELNLLNQNIFQDEKQCLIGKKTHYVVNKQRNYKFMIHQNNKSFYKNIEYVINNSLGNQQNYRNFAFVMPKNGTHQSILQILKCFYILTKHTQIKYNIYIFENQQQSISNNLLQLNKISQQYSNKKKIQYYVHDLDQQVDYSQEIQKKIQLALFQGESKIYVTKEYPKSPTYLCSFKQEKLKVIGRKQQYELKIFPDKVTVDINGLQFQIPAIEVKKVQKDKKNKWVPITLNIFRLDLKYFTQTNLLTDTTKNIQKKQILVQNPYGNQNLNIQFNYKINEVCILYKSNQQDEVDKARNFLKKLIIQQKLTQIYKLPKQINQNNISILKQFAKDNKIVIEFNGNIQIKLSSFDRKSIDLTKKKIDYLTKFNHTIIKYPEYWMHQNQQIQIFVVSPLSPQFKTVQTNFKIQPIRQLIRIQNKILYNKFVNEKQSLIQLNEGNKLHTMMLYHGTSKTNPKFIYEDKQESFNINYTSYSNYLGKGTYFAEQARYSNSYAYKESQKGETIKSMFYCQVIVGQSQKVQHINLQNCEMYDTDFKDIKKRLRFQSATTFTSYSNIYAVYKNRRAYPHYLIKY